MKWCNFLVWLTFYARVEHVHQTELQGRPYPKLLGMYYLVIHETEM